MLLTVTVEADTLKILMNAAYDGMNQKLNSEDQITVQIGRDEKKAIREFEAEVKSAQNL